MRISEILESEKVSKFGNLWQKLIEFRGEKIPFSLYHTGQSVSLRLFCLLPHGARGNKQNNRRE